MIRRTVVSGMLIVLLGALDASGQTATVTGRVTDSLTSAPIAGATVSAIYPGGSNVVSAETVTGANGQYVFGVAPGTYNLRGTRAGYRPEFFNDVKCQSVCFEPPPAPRWTLSAGSTFTADFALDLLAEISGTVVDASTLAPLVSTPGISYSVSLFDSGGELTTIAETDASGHYAIAGLLPGTYFVAMRNPPGYVPELHHDIPCLAADCPPTVGTAVVLGAGTAATINFALDPGGVITGTVRRASNGSGIQGLTVSVYKSSKTLVASAVTGAGGTYGVSGLPTGSYFAVVGAGSSSPASQDYLFEAYGGIVCPSIECQVTLGAPIAVTQGATTAGIDFSLDHGGTISGTVFAGGAPAPSQSFVSAYAGNLPVATAVVAANGMYSIVGLPPGAYQVAAVALSSPYASQCIGCPGTPPAVVVAAGAIVSNINFSLPISSVGAISGNVSCERRLTTDFNSGPQIYVYDQSGHRVRSTAETLPFGTCFTYTIDELPAGQYYLLARDTPSIPFGTRPFGGVFIDKLYGDIVCMTVDCDVRRGLPVTVTAGQTTANINFDMKQGAGLSAAKDGELTIFDSRGVAMVSVVRSSFFFSAQQAVGLPPGTYFARLGNRLYGRGLCVDCPPSSGQPIVIGPNQGEVFLDFGPPSTSRFSGAVTDSAGGVPLSNIGVDVYSTTGRLLASGTSDVTGHYVIGGETADALPPGKYFLKTRNHREYVDEVFPGTICAGCDVRIGTAIDLGTSEVSGIDFALSAGGVVGGTVTDAAGVAVDGVPVAFFNSAGEFVGQAVKSGSFGLYDLTLPAGNYRARAQASDSHGAEVFTERPCTSAGCNVIAGTPIAVTAGTVVSNINFTLATCGAMTLSPPLLSSGAVGHPYRQVISTSGGVSPYVYQLTDGLLPVGLTLATSGLLDGTPAASARHAFTIGVVDAIGCATTRAYTLDVQQCAFTLSPSSATVPASGGTITVAISDACGSQAVTGLSFVTVQSNTVGQVVLDVPAYTGAAVRSNDLNIGRRVFTVRQAGLTVQPPFGALDAPADGAQVSGSIAVGGWALDDLEVTRVQIFRDPVAGEPAVQIFIGTAVFVAGARPDVARAYPAYPFSNRAGWGYLILTNMLPNQGNGIFRIYAYADDAEGARALLGAKTIVANNATATLPFGAIDTPGQGETIAGSGYLNWAWALTPQPKMIPTDGSTIQVYVDGVPQGSPVYNLFRPDVSGLFPGLANSGGPVGYRVIDTTALAEGQHTIAWVVVDSAGVANGIGSRYFSVANSADAQARPLTEVETSVESRGLTAFDSVATAPSIAVVAGPDSGRRAASLASAPVADPPVIVQDVAGLARRVQTNTQGKRTVTLRALERLELILSDAEASCSGTWAGYLVSDDALGDLPVGAAIDPTGRFFWQPGPGFAGRFELLFVQTTCDGTKKRVPLSVTVQAR